MNIACVCGDIGGTVDLLPVVREFILQNNQVNWYVDGSRQARAGTVLQAEKIPFSVILPDQLSVSLLPNLIVVGTSATAIGAQLAWTAFGHAQGIPVVWLEDMYGTASVPAARQSVPPNLFVVIDQEAEAIVRRAWVNSRVYIGGKPSFANELAIALEERKRGQDTFRKPGCLSVVYATGSSRERIRQHLEAFLHAHRNRFGRYRFLVRFHAKLPDEDKVALHEEFADRFSAGTYIDLPMSLGQIISGDVVVADYASTVGYQAVLAGVPVIVPLFPDTKEKCVSRGFVYGEPPIVRTGACFSPRSKGEFAVMLAGIDANSLTVREMLLETAIPFRSLLRQNAAADIVREIERLR